ncbi:FAD-dependent monooxygenase [Methylobacterium frigidaeris]|uniref:3-(3-hydroxy-phenyl)propionate/3-hydroxycinnamic acid hydroxylase n=1 Tax=Methylobacterium frigidaeris TaxID=2038277 RepID=A0AA37M3Q1_9HYPH|nr:FAD-dependent monooxygenase [Methylobacterium frigidaeris]PIK68987.1 monooxygenase [Methylobacterium frigidaeris]GJD61672.1 3-(3-hydroxy-phenyl)propionate/3-hydroxycinnamic acid hydroxylase [Methylobacterium frigidaeris]
MSAAPPVLIVGAGPTGLNLALQLARRGVPVRIVDRAEGPGTASRAMAVQARTLEFYRQLGFADAVVAEGVPIPAVRLREGGEEVARVSFHDLGAGESPYPFVLAYAQDDHERLLVRELARAGIVVEWGTALAALSQDGAGIRATLSRGGAGEVCTPASLCGCDGAHSRVREALGIGFPGGTYDQLFYVADARIAGGFHEELTVNLGAHGLGLLLPVRLSGMQRLIGLVPDALTSHPGLSFEDLRPGVEALMGIRVEAVRWFSTYRVHYRVAERFRAGRCFLAGDAGHIHSPAGGQGMNTGIGDAVNLGWKLAETVAGRADPALLDTYEPERIAFARNLVSTTDRAFRALTGPGLGGQMLRTLLLPHLVPALWGFAAARKAMFDTVSQVRIAYHDSPLSAGRAGRVRGGDRLPWAGDPDNFAPLASLAWQLHVYGAGRPGLAEEARRAGLPLHAFPWTGAAREAGFSEGAAYLVRPDGYVALAGPDSEELMAYCGRWGIAAKP